MRHVQEVARHALDLARPYAARGGFEHSLSEVERLLSNGNGADRQRAAFARGGLPEVLRHLVTESTPEGAAVPACAPLLEGAA
jgi:carboxylate-amine ligase